MTKSLLIKNCQAYNSQKPKFKNSKNMGCFLNAKNGFKTLLLMVGISSLAYIFQINQLATMGQELNEKETKLEELKEEQRSLEIKIAQFKADYHFESERERLNLINPEQVSFVEIGGNDSVAMVD